MHVCLLFILVLYIFIQVRAHKLMVRWLLGLTQDEKSLAPPVLKVLDTTLANDGDLNGQDNVR